MGSCRAVLGSESGSNVFDWSGDLERQIAEYLKKNPHAMEEEVYQHIVAPLEIDGAMNQVSPRVFEAIMLRTALVLFEGTYSNVLIPNEHFIPLKKDGSNLKEIFEKLANDDYVDALTSRALNDIVLSGKYSYKGFVDKIDSYISIMSDSKCFYISSVQDDSLYDDEMSSRITTAPEQYNLAKQGKGSFVFVIWSYIPEILRMHLRPTLRLLLKQVALK